MKLQLALAAVAVIAFIIALAGGWITLDQFRDQTFYVGQLVLGWGAWVCFIALVYAGFENPSRIRGHGLFAAAGVALTGGAFVWWAWYFSKVPGAGGDVLPCLVYSVPRCDVAAKVPGLANVAAYNPMMMWAGAACLVAWLILTLTQTDSDRPNSVSRPERPTAGQ